MTGTHMTSRSKQTAPPIQKLDLLLDSSNATAVNANGIPIGSVSKFGCRPPVINIELVCLLKRAITVTYLLSLTSWRTIMSRKSSRCWMAGRVSAQWSSRSSTITRLVRRTRQTGAMLVKRASATKSLQNSATLNVTLNGEGRGSDFFPATLCHPICVYFIQDFMVVPLPRIGNAEGKGLLTHSFEINKRPLHWCGGFWLFVEAMQWRLCPTFSYCFPIPSSSLSVGLLSSISPLF